MDGRSRRIIPCGQHCLLYRGWPLVMGVLNVTPDSFSDGGRFLDPRAAVQRGRELEAEGADLIDIGGESTRPGARPVALSEELRRTLPVVERLARSVRIPLAIDTTKADVARRALEAGASIVNDVSALRDDPQMAAVVARAGAAVILMHRRGTPQTMQRRPSYRDVVGEVAAFLSRMAQQAGRVGIAPERILIDPGLGFGKSLRHNLELMGALSTFTALGYPVVVGPSRKSFIGRTLKAEVEDRPRHRATAYGRGPIGVAPASGWAGCRPPGPTTARAGAGTRSVVLGATGSARGAPLAGTLACVVQAWWQGVQVVRVHDVQPTVHLLRMLNAVQAVRSAASPLRGERLTGAIL